MNSLPHYFEQYVDGEGWSVRILGEITEKEITSITKNKHSNWEIEKLPSNEANLRGYSCYFRDEYTSTKEEFEDLLSQFKAFVRDL